MKKVKTLQSLELPPGTYQTGNVRSFSTFPRHYRLPNSQLYGQESLFGSQGLDIHRRRKYSSVIGLNVNLCYCYWDTPLLAHKENAFVFCVVLFFPPLNKKNWKKMRSGTEKHMRQEYFFGTFGAILIF